jgi:hypothetical protein
VKKAKTESKKNKVVRIAAEKESRELEACVAARTLPHEGGALIDKGTQRRSRSSSVRRGQRP